MSYEMNDLLNLMVESGASDLHIQVGVPPTMRINGDMVPVEGGILDSIQTEELMTAIASESDLERVKSRGDSDFGFSYMDKTRFRVSLMKAMGSYGMVLRQIPNKIKSLDDIGFPPSIKDLLQRPRGLILITGPTGSGKTTTLASMIDWINSNVSGHIITIEDPIEYVFEHNKCIISQKEIGVDVKNYASALRSALRQDPDILLVGELRDKETIEAAIAAAETGHLVFGTVHTTSAARTVDRLIDVFPVDTRDEIRAELASTLIGVVSQTLLKCTQGGRVAAFEIMVQTDGIAALIREGKTFQIPSEIQTGAKAGMVTLDDHMKSLYAQGLIEPEEAIKKSHYPDHMKDYFKKHSEKTKTKIA